MKTFTFVTCPFGVQTKWMSISHQRERAIRRLNRYNHLQGNYVSIIRVDNFFYISVKNRTYLVFCTSRWGTGTHPINQEKSRKTGTYGHPIIYA